MAHQRLLGDANPPSQILDIAIRKHHTRCKLDPKHLLNSKHDPFRVLAISLNQATEALVDGVRCDLGITVEAVPDNGKKCVFNGCADEAVGIDASIFLVEAWNMDFKGTRDSHHVVLAVMVVPEFEGAKCPEESVAIKNHFSLHVAAC